jgi:hypothetical protein
MLENSLHTPEAAAGEYRGLLPIAGSLRRINHGGRHGSTLPICCMAGSHRET